MMSEELKSCPFCGKSDIHIEQKGTFFWCECYDCGAIGRGYYTQPGVNVLQSEDIARGYWNQRPLEDALHTRIAELEAAQARWVMASERLPKVSGWYLTGLVYFLGSPYSSEVYFDAENIEPRWNNITSDKIYCWLDGVPELPQPLEVQE